MDDRLVEVTDKDQEYISTCGLISMIKGKYEDYLYIYYI